MKEGDVVGLVQRKRTAVAVIVGRIEAHGQPDDHYGVVFKDNRISWHFPDALYAPGATHANGVTVLHVHDAEAAKPALVDALNRKQVQVQLKARTTLRYASDGKTLLWKAAAAKAEDMICKPGERTGAPEKCHEPWKLSAGDGSELGHEMVAYLDDGGMRVWLLQRLKEVYPRRHYVLTMREDLGAPHKMIAALLNTTEHNCQQLYWSAKQWMRQESQRYYERNMEEAS